MAQVKSYEVFNNSIHGEKAVTSAIYSKTTVVVIPTEESDICHRHHEFATSHIRYN